MADRLPIVRDIDPAKPQRPAGFKPMQIVSDSYSQCERGWVSLCWRNAVSV
jgi:hypothetical protein